MSIELYDYHIDFVQTNGAYMKLRKSETHGFSKDDFQELQLKMIQSNTIPRLVPIRFEEKNGETSIFYRVEGLRRLRAIVKEKPMSMQDYYALFINIVQAIQDATNNMLDEDHYVLNEDFIYIGQNYHQVYLTYLPLKEISEKVNMHEKLKKLLLNLAGEVQGIHGGQFKMILSYIKDPGFSLQGLKKLLQDLQTVRPVDEAQGAYESSESGVVTTNEMEEVTITKKVKKLPPLPRKMKIYTVLIGLLLIAASWKLSEGSSSAMMIVSAVLSVIIIAGVVIYLFFWRPGVEPIITEKEVMVKRPKKQVDKKPQQTAANQQQASQTASEQHLTLQDLQLEMDAVKQSEEPVTASAETQQAPAFSKRIEETTTANQQDGVHEAAASSVAVVDKPRTKNTAETAKKPAASFTGNTAVADLEEDVPKASGLRDQTVLLDEGDLLGTTSKQVKNYLIAEADGKKNELEADNIIIGRSPKAAQLVDTGVGVSRSHVELVKLSDTYGVKDLGSKNGTFLNNKRLIPYKIHEMNHDDTVQIGKSIYTYKVQK